MKHKRIFVFAMAFAMLLTQSSFAMDAEAETSSTPSEPSEVVESVEETESPEATKDDELVPSEEGSEEPITEPEEDFPLIETPDLDMYILDNPAMADENGNVTLNVTEDKPYVDFYFPEKIGDNEVKVIGVDAFKGCEVFRTVVIPATVMEIGENAFVDCTNLEFIIFLDRNNTEDMLLGENWSGDAEIVFGFIEKDAEISEEEASEETEAFQEEVEDPSEVPPAEEPSNNKESFEEHDQITEPVPVDDEPSDLQAAETLTVSEDDEASAISETDVLDIPPSSEPDTETSEVAEPTPEAEPQPSAELVS